MPDRCQAVVDAGGFSFWGGGSSFLSFFAPLCTLNDLGFCVCGVRKGEGEGGVPLLLFERVSRERGFSLLLMVIDCLEGGKGGFGRGTVDKYAVL